MTEKRKKGSILSRLRNYFFAGAVVLIPIGITLYLSLFIIKVSTKLLPKELNPNSYLNFEIPGIEIIIAIFLITFIGWLSLSFLGKKIFELINRILKNTYLRTIYSAINQMTESLTKSDNKQKSVVLLEYPKKDVWAVGSRQKKIKVLLMIKLETNLLMFLFYNSNPTSGFY